MKVEANYRGRGKYYPGVIGRERANGTFDIDYDDGEREIGVDQDYIRLISSAASSPARGSSGRLEEGAKVEGNYRGRGRWYPAVVKRERANGTFDIDYDDGEKELGVKSDLIRVQEIGFTGRRRSRSPPQETTYEEIDIGTNIEACYKGGSKWYSAKIKEKHSDGTYDVRYDDGDIELSIKRSMIRIKKNDVPPPLPTPAVEPESTEADSAASAASEDTAAPAEVEASATPSAEVNAKEGG